MFHRDSPVIKNFRNVENYYNRHLHPDIDIIIEGIEKSQEDVINDLKIMGEEDLIAYLLQEEKIDSPKTKKADSEKRFSELLKKIREVMDSEKTEDLKYEINSNDVEIKIQDSRFILGKKGKRPIICIGVNPSTATKEKDDPTIRRVVSFSERGDEDRVKYDGWVMMNLYPQRSTDPKEIHKNINEELHQLNIAAIETALENISKHFRPTIWVAWGNLIDSRSFLKSKCLKDIYEASKKFNCKWVNLGEKTKSGNPRHPLYLKGTSEFYEFNIEEYLKNQ